MVEMYQIQEAEVLMRLARYLLVKADQRGLTHGEKHHFTFVALSLIGDAQTAIGDTSHSVLTRNDQQELKLSDIPF